MPCNNPHLMTAMNTYPSIHPDHVRKETGETINYELAYNVISNIKLPMYASAINLALNN